MDLANLAAASPVIPVVADILANCNDMPVENPSALPNSLAMPAKQNFEPHQLYHP